MKSILYGHMISQYDISLPQDIELVSHHEADKDLIREFAAKYYDDQNSRFHVFGINPGRLGSGITGIPFTDTEHYQAEATWSTAKTEIVRSVGA